MQELEDFPAQHFLVGGWATPLKNMSSSVGMMKLPIYEFPYSQYVTNHQPNFILRPMHALNPFAPKHNLVDLLKNVGTQKGNVANPPSGYDFE